MLFLHSWAVRIIDKKSLCRCPEALGEEKIRLVHRNTERKKDFKKQTNNQMVCASARVWPLPGGLLPSQQEAEYGLSGFSPTNNQTNKPNEQEAKYNFSGFNPKKRKSRGFTTLPPQEAEYSFSGFIQTNKQIGHQRTRTQKYLKIK